ncbi:transposase family protein [Streptomyces sp. RTd22]|uniref:transposase family protein n=1 Tax=Streptomyces sp. RTd22 TaxID=1841249 RepID=UPI003B63FD85
MPTGGHVGRGRRRLCPPDPVAGRPLVPHRVVHALSGGRTTCRLAATARSAWQWPFVIGSSALSVKSLISTVVVDRLARVSSTLRITARCTTLRTRCPECGTSSGRVHSRYVRRLADAAIGGQMTAIDLEVRRFFCDNGGCGKKTFAEQVEGSPSATDVGPLYSNKPWNRCH